jgi:hypothetical protein
LEFGERYEERKGGGEDERLEKEARVQVEEVREAGHTLW